MKKDSMKVDLNIEIENRNELKELLEAIEKNTTDLKNNVSKLEGFEFEVNLAQKQRHSDDI